MEQTADKLKSLTNFVNTLVKGLVPENLEESIKKVDIDGISKVDTELNKADKKQAVRPASAAAPKLNDSAANNYKGFVMNISFPDELVTESGENSKFGFKELYRFVLFKTLSCDEKLSQGSNVYFSQLSDDYFQKQNFKDIADVNILSSMYVTHILEELNMPSYDTFITLSAEQYEKGESNAQILFAEKPVPKNKMICSFQQPILFSGEKKKVRQVRKVMEMTKKSGMTLVAERNQDNREWSLMGLAGEEVVGNKVIFKGKLSWTLKTSEKEIFHYYKGKYTLNFGNKQNEYETQIDEYVPEKYADKIKKLVEILKKQEHGTAALVLQKKLLMEELDRLCKHNKGIRINGFDFVEDKNADNRYQVGMTNIDGAIFLDEEGVCYGLGVIVDGPTKVDGDSGRGARYNSINNYVSWVITQKKEYRDYLALGVVVSEDGMVDVIKPQKCEG